MRTIWIIALFCCAIQLHSQTWKMRIERMDAPHRTKTIRVQPGLNLKIGSQIIYTDSLKETRMFNGIFLAGTHDSLQMKLGMMNSSKTYSNGITETAKIPAKYILSSIAPDTNRLSLALKDIAFLECRNEKISGWSELGEPILLLSLLAMVASPFICYDYKERSLNADKYKYWAVGSSIGITTGFATVFTFAILSKHKKVQFREGWPEKKAKVWKFNNVID